MRGSAFDALSADEIILRRAASAENVAAFLVRPRIRAIARAPCGRARRS